MISSTPSAWASVGKNEKWTVRVTLTRDVASDDAVKEVTARLLVGGVEKDTKKVTLRTDAAEKSFHEELTCTPFEKDGLDSAQAEVRFETESKLSIPPIRITVFRLALTRAAAAFALATSVFAMMRLWWIASHPAATYSSTIGSRVVVMVAAIPSVPLLRDVAVAVLAPWRKPFKRSIAPHPAVTAALSAVVFAIGWFLPTFATVIRNNAPENVKWKDGDELRPNAEGVVVSFAPLEKEFFESEIDDADKKLCASRFALEGDAGIGTPLAACAARPAANVEVRRPIWPLAPTPRGVSFNCAGKRWPIEKALVRDGGSDMLEHAEVDDSGALWISQVDGGCKAALPAKATVDVAALLGKDFGASALARVVLEDLTTDVTARVTAALTETIGASVHDDRKGDPSITFEAQPGRAAGVEWYRVTAPPAGSRFPSFSAPVEWRLAWGSTAGKVACPPGASIHVFLHSKASSFMLIRDGFESTWTATSPTSEAFAVCTTVGDRFTARVPNDLDEIIIPKEVPLLEVMTGRRETKPAPCPEAVKSHYVVAARAGAPTCVDYVPTQEPPPAQPLTDGCCFQLNTDPLVAKPCTSQCEPLLSRLKPDARKKGCNPRTARWCQ